MLEYGADPMELIELSTGRYQEIINYRVAIGHAVDELSTRPSP